MQKVEGSNPFSRFFEAPATAGVFVVPRIIVVRRRVLRWGSYEVRREDLRAAHGEGEVEAVRVLAAGGHLTGGEIEEIREAALEAAERIGTDREQGTMTATGWEPFTADRLAVAIAEKMEAGSG